VSRLDVVIGLGPPTVGSGTVALPCLPSCPVTIGGISFVKRASILDVGKYFAQ
jgi:hypothetical protein